MKFPLILLGLKLGSIAALALAQSPLAIAIEPYGLSQPISYADAAILSYLAWPQSRGAMVDRLGFPNGYDDRWDYYSLPDGGYIAVEYEGSTAVGFQRGF